MLFLVGFWVGVCGGYQDMWERAVSEMIVCEGLVGYVRKGSSAMSLRRWGPGRDWGWM